MATPAKPANEEDRLAALHALEILDTPSHETYDGITRFACNEFGVSVSAITLLDAERQWFKSAIGVSVNETLRAMSFCAHTILEDEPVVVPNTTKDERFCKHPLVVAEQRFRFYAGHRIHDPTGYAIGAFELVHDEPKDFDKIETAKLVELAKITETQIAMDYGNNQKRPPG